MSRYDRGMGFFLVVWSLSFAWWPALAADPMAQHVEHPFRNLAAWLRAVSKDAAFARSSVLRVERPEASSYLPDRFRTSRSTRGGRDLGHKGSDDTTHVRCYPRSVIEIIAGQPPRDVRFTLSALKKQAHPWPRQKGVSKSILCSICSGFTGLEIGRDQDDI